jgi:hypothetical protein
VPTLIDQIRKMSTRGMDLLRYDFDMNWTADPILYGNLIIKHQLHWRPPS